jgi:transposase
MSVSVLGIDIAKQKFDVALFTDGKIKHKACRNSVEGFEALMFWLEKQGVQKVHAKDNSSFTTGWLAGLKANFVKHEIFVQLLSD